MKQTFTKEFMYENSGCYDKSRLDKCSFMNLDVITLESIVNSEIQLKDKFWFVCQKAATIEENKEIACSVAEIVLPIYEKRYPENKAPREAVEAARAYLAGHIALDQLLIKRRAAAAYAAAADAADATADAAYATAAAAAAYAAAAAADAAAYAAYAAADAADAAAYAAYAAAADAAITKQLQDFLNTFVKANP